MLILNVIRLTWSRHSYRYQHRPSFEAAHAFFLSLLRSSAATFGTSAPQSDFFDALLPNYLVILTKVRWLQVLGLLCLLRIANKLGEHQCRSVQRRLSPYHLLRCFTRSFICFALPIVYVSSFSFSGKPSSGHSLGALHPNIWFTSVPRQYSHCYSRGTQGLWR